MMKIFSWLWHLFMVAPPKPQDFAIHYESADGPDVLAILVIEMGGHEWTWFVTPAVSVYQEEPCLN